MNSSAFARWICGMPPTIRPHTETHSTVYNGQLQKLDVAVDMFSVIFSNILAISDISET